MKLPYKWLFIEVCAEFPRTWGSCTHYTFKSISEGVFLCLFFCTCWENLQPCNFNCLLVLGSWENQKYSVLLVGISILIGMQICLIEMHRKEPNTRFTASVMVKRSSSVEQNQDDSLNRHSLQKRLWEKGMQQCFSVCLLVLWLMTFLWVLLQMLASFVSGGIASLISLCQHFWMQAWSWSKSSIVSLDLPGS